MAASIQFFRGVDETVIPEIKLTRSRDGMTGQALFITGMFLLDDEGELITRDVKGRFVNGKASALEATYTWKSEADFERFMRFAERYAEGHELGFNQS
jgi:photosystem II 13kDa protein